MTLSPARKRVNGMRALFLSERLFNTVESIVRLEELTGGECFDAGQGPVTFAVAGQHIVTPDEALQLMRDLARHLVRYAEKLATP